LEDLAKKNHGEDEAGGGWVCVEHGGHDQSGGADCEDGTCGGALMFIDAVHYAPHGLIDLKALDCDFLACSPYKFFGPHMGTLYGKKEHLERFKPYKVRPATNVSPECWETGTQVHELIAGIGAAVDTSRSWGDGATLPRKRGGKRWRRRIERRCRMNARCLRNCLTG